MIAMQDLEETGQYWKSNQAKLEIRCIQNQEVVNQFGQHGVSTRG